MDETAINDRWLLPEGIEELLPPQAEQLERLRRQLLDLFHVWGYELVIPPFIEYLESLHVGTGSDLDLQTFKLTDQLTGRMMGVRADMTPQVARIDAHHLQRPGPVRLCYLGSVLRTRPDGIAGSRCPLQVGAELYGHAGVESDVEILCLMLESLGSVGLDQVYLDLGHVGVFRGLSHHAGLTPEQESLLFDALQRKAKPEIEALLAPLAIDRAARAMLLGLADLNGSDEVLAEARLLFRGAPAEVLTAIDNIERIAELTRRRTAASFHFDLAELRGYRYHTGAVFAAYAPSRGQAVAQGGRYDAIGGSFGLARPATGFSADLKSLMAMGPESRPVQAAIFGPAIDDAALLERIGVLRAAGERVIRELPGQAGGARELGCDRALVRRDGAWVVTELENA